MAGTFGRSGTGRRDRRRGSIVAAAWSFRVERERGAVGRLNDALDRTLRERIPEATLRALQVALDELLTNVIVHARRADGPIDVVVSRGPDVLDARISYRADAFDPTAFDCEGHATTIETSRIGGHGIALVRALMDDFGYRHEAGCNVVVLRKRC
jgi:anti-sigma regulatory factor (Ser/Thr protein kinase)